MDFVAKSLCSLCERDIVERAPLRRERSVRLRVLRAAAVAFGLWTTMAEATPLRVTVRVRAEDQRPVEGAAVKSGSARAATDAAGAALLLLPFGPQTITITRLGFLPDTLQVVVQADTSLEAVLHEGVIELAPVTISSTRANRRIEDEPERVEVLAAEDVNEKSLTRPGDVTTLVKEIPGVRPQ